MPVRDAADPVDRRRMEGCRPLRFQLVHSGFAGSGSYMNFLQNGMSMPPIPLPTITIRMNTSACYVNSPADMK